MYHSELYTKLIEYSQSNAYPFHMPGHKRRLLSMEDPYRFDLTEIDGFDNLHEAEDVLKREQERAAALYHSEETHFMVNGSTGGILSAVAGVLHRGDKVLVARNCHKSVYHAIELNGLCPVYLWPELDTKTGIYRGLCREPVEAALEKYPDIRAVILTSPTYEGLLSDVKGICEAAHARGIPCIVDEAHGAHLRWTGVPDGVACGADVVIQSLHKTMPSLTQTALLHINGGLVDRDRLRKMLAIYQTSSPSYVLMASISQCIAWASAEGDTAFAAYRQRTERLRRRLAALKHLHLYVPEGAFDWGKLVICTGDSGLSGAELSKRLRKDYALQVEMVSAEYVLAMTTVGDSDEGFERLAEALEQMDAEVPLNRIGHRTFGFSESLFSDGPALPERSMDIHEALEQPMEELPLAASAGRVAGDYLYLYPPGIPILVPGEVIQMQHIKQIQYDLDRGLEVHGGYIKEKGHVKVILYHG